MYFFHAVNITVNVVWLAFSSSFRSKKMRFLRQRKKALAIKSHTALFEGCALLHKEANPFRFCNQAISIRSLIWRWKGQVDSGHRYRKWTLGNKGEGGEMALFQNEQFEGNFSYMLLSWLTDHF